MLRWTGGATVDAVVEATVGHQLEAVAVDKLGVTVLKLIEGNTVPLEASLPFHGILNDVLVQLYAVVDAVGACKSKPYQPGHNNMITQRVIWL